METLRALQAGKRSSGYGGAPLAQGAGALCTGCRPRRVRDAAASLAAGGAEVLGLRLDVADARSIHAFYDAAEAALAPVDVVVNCAAHARPGARPAPSSWRLRGPKEGR